MNNLVDDSPAPKSQDFDIDRPRRNPDMSKRILINSYRIVHRDSLDLNSKDGIRRGTFTVLPQRCIGARKYSSMVGSVAVNATQQLVIYGGQGNLEW